MWGSEEILSDKPCSIYPVLKNFLTLHRVSIRSNRSRSVIFELLTTHHVYHLRISAYLAKNSREITFSRSKYCPKSVPHNRLFQHNLVNANEIEKCLTVDLFSLFNRSLHELMYLKFIHIYIDV